MSPLCSGSDYALVLMILGKVADAGSNRNEAASGPPEDHLRRSPSRSLLTENLQLTCRSRLASRYDRAIGTFFHRAIMIEQAIGHLEFPVRGV